MVRPFDVRAGEARGSVLGFSLLLLVVITAHTTLETARDALLLTGPGPKALGFVYMAIAALTVPGAALVSLAGRKLGQRRALALTLVIAALGPLALFTIRNGQVAGLTTYVLSGMLGSIVVPQFWTLVGTGLTVAQGRRLFGLISAAGTVGGVLGPAIASAALWFLPVRSLMLFSSGLFALALVALGLVRVTERREEPTKRQPIAASLQALRQQPFLARVALVVLLSTATFLSIDYLFKWTLATHLPGPRIGPFVAHYYLALNGVSLVVQLLLTGPVVRRLGMVPALVLTPLLLAFTAVAATASGGALALVLLVKGVDGSLRYSLHRVTQELVYLPVPLAARKRAKPLIDGGLVRLAQTVTGAAMLVLDRWTLIGPRSRAALVVVLAMAWLGTVITMRRPYLRLLRRAISTGSFDDSESTEPIDLEAAQILEQHLASDDPLEVRGAMAVLSRRGQAGLVPALILLHQDDGVLAQALEMFGSSARSDWFSLARRLLHDPREGVRIAATRALSRHDQIDAAFLANDEGLRARGYASVRMALRDDSVEVLVHPSVAGLLAESGVPGERARLGMLAAIADSPSTPRLGPLLRRVVRPQPSSREETELVAQAVARQKDISLVPSLIARLSERDGREAIRDALVSFGEPALADVRRALHDPATPRRLRLHLPKTIARFASARAAESLLHEIVTEKDGAVRYKAIRALRLLVTEHRIRVDRERASRLACDELEKHFRYLALGVAVAPAVGAAPPSIATVLLALLAEKAAQALQRAFYLLEIAYPREGVGRAYVALRSEDSYVRANAAELLDALLHGRGRERLRELFRLATDELPARERVGRAGSLVPSMAQNAEGALKELSLAEDPILVALGAQLLGRPGRPAAAGVGEEAQR